MPFIPTDAIQINLFCQKVVDIISNEGFLKAISYDMMITFGIQQFH